MIVALYRFLFTRLLFLMFLFSLCRLLFYLFYSDQFQNCTTEQVVSAFVLGMRFDISILLGANLIFLVFLSIGRFFPIPKSLYILAKILFVCANSILIILNVIDLEYFGFTGKRTGIEILGIRHDIADQMSQLMLNYWNLVLLSFMLFLWILLRTLRLKYTPV
ncbi:MAG: LTA synthase family protein, partial [Cytophagales bacterium]|nr:LTA synthase family protein [Cytophaga sp.]